MDQPPTGPMPFEPPSGPPQWPILDATSCWTGPPMRDPLHDTPYDSGDATARDTTDRQPSGAIRPGGRVPRSWVPRFISEEAFQSLRGHLASAGLALLVALPTACAVFFALGALRFSVDDRTLWNSVAHSLAQFWYVLLCFVLVAFPPSLVAIRRGGREAQAFVVDRGYWKVMLTAFVVIPALAALIAFIVGHVLIVLVVVVVLVVVIVHSGGF